ncbi:MAG: DUF4384 domain-containing protein [Treponema sp.]|nr:DUF4384 domain-containing protein [Treponema sp.]MCL2272980.1 DUF4384 domain-containing protein [Treponema sp.]
MKKIVLISVLIFTGAVFLTAEDYNVKVRNAVNQLASRLNASIDVSVGNIFLDGTESSTGLSRNLYNKISTYTMDNIRFNLINRSRSASRVTAGAAQRGIIEGTYEVLGSNVEITLRLVSDPGERVLGQTQFTVPVSELGDIDILPENFKSQDTVREQENIFSSVPVTKPESVPAPNQTLKSPGASVNDKTFLVAAWPNSDTNTFFNGDELKITIEANKDCFFKVYHIDHNNNMQMIFPNSVNRNNRLAANTQRTVPDAGMRYNIAAPFGQDTILVIASTQQFENLEAEFPQVQKATTQSVNNILQGRGIDVQRIDQKVVQSETISTRFNFTSLPATYYDDIFKYQKPDSMRDIINAMRAEVIQYSGTFTGSEQEGTFSYPGVQGRYYVKGNDFFICYRYTQNQAAMSQTRSAKNPYVFSIEKPRNMTEAVQSVRAGIEASGGTFSGDEQQGEFRAKGITGQYVTGNSVDVSIFEKPFIVPNSMIEKEVRSYFSGK